MKKEIVKIPGIKTTGLPYSQVVKAGNILYLSGQISCDLATGEFINGNIKEQTNKAIENIRYLLENSNSSLENVLKVNVYMNNISEIAQMNETYKEYFKDGNEPTRVAIQTIFPNKDLKIEIEVVALAN